MKKKIILVTILFCFGILKAQDPLFTQFFSNSLQLNPALAGRDLSPRFHTTYRNQWPEINNSFITYNVEYDQFSDQLHGELVSSCYMTRLDCSLNTTSFQQFILINYH